MGSQDLDIKDIYYRVIAITNGFWVEATGVSLTVEDLKKIDPTVAQLARTMRMLATVMKDLAGDSWEDEKMATNAFQCCLIMERLAAAVDDDTEEDLEQILHDLELHANVP